MDIASFNVNSIKARQQAFHTWLIEAKPDIVCLQELKTPDAVFVQEAFEDLGYNIAVNGQKSYNGVAILSKYPFEEIIHDLPIYDEIGQAQEDTQARYLEVVVQPDGFSMPFRVASLYVPNGNPAFNEDGSFHDKYTYKLDWLRRLRKHAQELLSYGEALVLAGDYNIIPSEHDTYDVELWANDALFLPQTRAELQALLWLGFTDAYTQTDGRPHQYTFWDYQRGARAKNHGIRIDHLLLSAQAVDCLKTVRIDDYVRDRERPSDHVPIIGSFG